MLPARRVEVPWPSYRFVPGLQPHPTKGEGGHGGCGLPDDTPLPRAIARGLDLVAGHFVWEAHEALEIGWRIAPEPTRTMLGGLIKLCAAILRAHLGDGASARRLLERARAQLGASEPPGLLGLQRCLHDIDAYIDGGPFPDLGCFATSAPSSP